MFEKDFKYSFSVIYFFYFYNHLRRRYIENVVIRFFSKINRPIVNVKKDTEAIRDNILIESFKPSNGLLIHKVNDVINEIYDSG